ncbi:MAG: helix-turn-helix transcriptional regulator [Euryarchaeota archaeon]|nr:helix-turn-helix transcriptional regulator [Euryarchaeota archaeon]
MTKTLPEAADTGHIPPVPADPTEEDRRMVRSLDDFLDELAAGHRARMEEVVEWLTRTGHLEREITASVEALSVLFHKWGIEVCFLLRMKGTLRFNEIKMMLGTIGSRTLSQRLKDLESQGIVARKAYAEVPVRVEYALTQRGMKMADLFLPVIAHLRISSVRERRRAEGQADPAGY